MNVFTGTNLELCYIDTVSAFDSGLNPHQIAEKFDISYDDVIFCLRNFGKFKSSIFVKFTEEQVNEIIHLCDIGNKVDYIAKKFNIDRHYVSHILKRYGRRSQGSNKKFDKVRFIPFSKTHRELVIGTLLGDGCVHRQRKNSNNMYKYYLSHSKLQEEYFLYKFEQLKPFITKYYNVETTLKSTGKTYQQLKATSIAHPEFKVYYDMFYKDGVKVVPKNIDVYLSPFVMALWYMDDGSLVSRGHGLCGSNLRICSLNFSYEDHLILQTAIKACFDINVKIGAYNRNNKPYYYISFNKRNSLLLKEIIQPYVLDSMKYKLNICS